MIVHRLALQRRRLFVVTLLTYLAGLLAFAQLDLCACSVRVVFVWSGTLAFAALVLTGLVVALAPAARRLTEALAAGALIGASMLAQGWVGPDPWWVPALATLGGALVIHALLYGRFWARAPFRFDWTTRRRFVAPCPPAAAWARLVPDPSAPGAHYSGVYLGEEAVPGHPDQVVQLTRAPSGQIIKTAWQITERRAPHALSYSYTPPGGGAAFSAGHFTLSLRPGGPGCEVRFAETVHDLSIPSALDLWFDDFGGELRSSMQAALQGRRDPTLWMADHPGRVAQKS